MFSEIGQCNNIPVVGAEFRVITFNDGTILEGYEGFFRIVPDDLTGIKTPEEILEIYNKQKSEGKTSFAPLPASGPILKNVR